jgi:homoserine kinase type II
MAVYTELRDDELQSFLALYDIGGLHSVKGIAEGVENSNFLLATDAGQFILTLYEKRVEEADLPFFLGLMEHLAARAIACPRPVTRRDGGALGRLAGRPAAIVTFLDGISIRRPSAGHCRQVGEALAAMHLAGAGFSLQRANALALPGWRPLALRCGHRADEVEPGLAQFIARELDFLESSWPANLPAGVIHADLFRDNVFFLSDRLSGLIDFYFACNDAFAYDVSICLNAWCFEPDWSFNVTKARVLLAGYASRRPLSGAEIAALPALCRGSAMRFLLTRLYDWLNVPAGALVTPHDPREYLAKLRFHRGVGDARAYGADG